MAYPGGKGGCYQKIINQIPPHRVYIETHLGGGAIMKMKRPAALNIGNDLNPIILQVTASEISPGGIVVLDRGAAPLELARAVDNGVSGGARPAYFFGAMDALAALVAVPFMDDEFIYLDPPYIMETRSTQRRIYQHEYSNQQHETLLLQIKRLDCAVAISGYWSEMYADLLAGWRSIQFTSQTRGGTPAEEWLWMNYDVPVMLHDYRYLGDGFRERERIKRKKLRWLKRLRRMDRLERAAIVSAIQESGMVG